MSPRRTIEFSDSNREALIIRWRATLVLGFVDYFSQNSQFSKLIVGELLDLAEGVIKALAEALEISLINPNGSRKGFQKLFGDIQAHDVIPKTSKRRIQQINNSLSAGELNSIRDTFRNADAHTLNLPTIPDETVKRCWRLFKQLVEACDNRLCKYAESRPEFKDFYYLQKFFYDYIVEQNQFDWAKVKLIKEVFKGRDTNQKARQKEKEVEIERERTVWEIIEYIKNGAWSSKEITAFLFDALLNSE